MSNCSAQAKGSVKFKKQKVKAIIPTANPPLQWGKK